MEKSCNHCKDVVESKDEHSAQWDLIKWQGKQQSKKENWLYAIIVILIAVIIGLCSAGLWVINDMTKKYQKSVEAVTQKYLDYLSLYDFSGYTIEGTQDGEGVNIIGGGDIDYGTNGEDNG